MERQRCLRAAAVVAALLVISGCGSRTGGAQTFDGSRAYDLLKKQCSFGPRYTGTTGHAATIDFIQTEMKNLADNVTTRTFEAEVDDRPLTFTNIYAVFKPDAERFVLLCAHWDTRPMADQEVDAKKQKRPISGANDGASGVAILMELARIFHEKKPDVGVVMAFFDGEDYAADSTEMFLGSKDFAKNWRAYMKSVTRNPGAVIDYGILLDMVGDSNLELPKEQRSVLMASKVVDKVWQTAQKMGYGDIFRDSVGYDVMDDHLPLNAGGIKCIDIIDFNYAYWHTLDDTVDKCSAKSLQIVGEVVAKVVYQESAAAK